ncbi:MAG TPA: M42 family metallopeptidase [Solirubrobacteraceae bacterium]|jgi:endoglucanase
MALPETLRALLTSFGPSGVEAKAAATWRDAARTFTDDVTGDVMGSTVARVPGTGSGPLVAVIGHIDEIGLIVTHIDDEGLLWFGQVGGWDPQILIGQRVEVATREGPIPGVVGKKPIHLLKPDERDKAPKLEDLHIDVGARDGDDARRRVRVGDVAVIAGEPVELFNGRYASRSMDNRLGAFVALEAARLVAEAGGAPGPVAAVASAQEEVGLWGAITSTFSLEPDVAIVVDVTHATDAPGVNKRTEGDHALGSGPVIGRGTVLHPAVHDLLVEAAEAESIPYTVEATGRGTGTDADVVHISRNGVATGLIGFPLRYMHSPVETMQLDDVENAARLIAAFALRLGADASFVR